MSRSVKKTVTDLDLHDQMIALGDAAKAAQKILQRSSHAVRQNALKAAAAAIREAEADLLEANAADVAQAREMGKDDAFIDRLALDEGRIEGMAAGLDAIAERPDPLGAIDQSWDRADGMHFDRVRVPLGVVAVIFESRPNVAADAAALCLKSGNATILRGGSESRRSVERILQAVRHGLEKAGLPAEVVNIVPTQDRAAVGELFRMTEHIDLLIPRGGRSLVARVQEESRVPVLGHLMGVNHSYVHASADPKMAQEVVVNAKMRRTGVCGATETMLIDRAIASEMLPGLVHALSAAGCRVRGDETAKSICPEIEAANESDWDQEWLDAVIGVHVVDGVDEALQHIDQHGTGHTECILASDQEVADRFLRDVDAAIVMHNASTQFADGGEFGFGAEIGIATGRLHARGPVGAEHLTSYHYHVRGTGHIRP
ncbi:gamma-glutamyl phosphate reductase [Iodidimonas gelatinilytica]|uniref:Gamma-glutamyl phosphate reductase n=1 Tax=Iodidimonas gelatinilytica TaxID=1236966 RepID=A0A5A7MNJ8_9PROT|nr:glutamate-5-semialdehyde dehydrogenase [Iodidimonas gelatinilytica]GEQ96538.1 gamma-glutamyl phosphate reductase [Iodidimonas gelatinilytica]